MRNVLLDGVFFAEWGGSLASLAMFSMVDVSRLSFERSEERVAALISSWRSRQEAIEVSFDHAGRTWDAGLKSQSRIEPLLKLEALPEGFFWTDHDNNDVPVTMDELRAIAAAMNLAIVERGFAIHQRQREMKQQLESMTAEELLEFEPGWPE